MPPRDAVGSEVHIACQPVGFATTDPAVPFTALPEFPLALETLQLSRAALAGFAERAEAAGIRYIGGCCGVNAHHVRAMAEALGRRPPAADKSPALDDHVLADRDTDDAGEDAGDADRDHRDAQPAIACDHHELAGLIRRCAPNSATRNITAPYPASDRTSANRDNRAIIAIPRNLAACPAGLRPWCE